MHVDADGHPVDGVYATGTIEDTANANGSFDENGNPIGQTVFTNTLDDHGIRTDSTSFSFHANGHEMHDQDAVQTLEFNKAHCTSG